MVTCNQYAKISKGKKYELSLVGISRFWKMI